MPGIDIYYRVKQATLKTGLAQSKRQFDTFSKDINRQFAALGGVGLTAGLTLLTRKAIDLGSALSDSAFRTKTNVESYQALEYAMRIAGGRSEDLERGLRNITVRTEEATKGNKSYLEALDRLGLATDEFVALPTEQKLEAIAKAYTMADNQQSAFADVVRIVGEESGPRMLEVLERLSGEGLSGVEQAAKDAGEVIDEELVRKLDEAADKIQSFQRKSTVAAAEGLSWFEQFGSGLGVIAEQISGREGMDRQSEQQWRDIAERQLEREGAFSGLKRKESGWFTWGQSVGEQRERLIDRRANYLAERSQMQSEVAAARDRIERRREVQAGAEEARAAKARGEPPPRRRNRGRIDRTRSSFKDLLDPFGGVDADPFGGLQSAAQAVRALERASGGGFGGLGDRPGADADAYRRVGIALSGVTGTINPETVKQTDILERIEGHMRIVADHAEEAGLEGNGDLADFAV